MKLNREDSLTEGKLKDILAILYPGKEFMHDKVLRSQVLEISRIIGMRN